VDIAVVLDPDLDSISDTLIDGPASRVVCLFLRQRDADGLNPIVAGSVADKGSPAATHIEDTHPRLESELACDEVVLGLLGLLQPERGARGGTGYRSVFPLEVGARIGHRRPEHELVELIPDVVVMSDGLRVTTP
jgi:hypothetical protein